MDYETIKQTQTQTETQTWAEARLETARPTIESATAEYDL